jgi:hypothetical protein
MSPIRWGPALRIGFAPGHLLGFLAVGIALLCTSWAPLTGQALGLERLQRPVPTARVATALLQYDYIKAYNFNLIEGIALCQATDLTYAERSVRPGGQLSETVVGTGQRLSRPNARTLLSLLMQDVDFRKQVQDSCGFQPHAAFVFFNRADRPVAFVDISFLCRKMAFSMDLTGPPKYAELPASEFRRFAQELGLIIVDQRYVRQHRLGQLTPAQLQALKPYANVPLSQLAHSADTGHAPAPTALPNTPMRQDTPTNPESKDKDTPLPGEDSEFLDEGFNLDGSLDEDLGSDLEDFNPSEEDMTSPPDNSTPEDFSQDLLEQEEALFKKELEDMKLEGGDLDSDIEELESGPPVGESPGSEESPFDDDPFDDDFEDFGSFDDIELDEELAPADSAGEAPEQ